MDRATHICTHCGYEGRPQKPPSDEEPSDGETGKALVKTANILLPGMGFLVKPLAIVITIPLYILLWPVKKYIQGGPKHCPNCGLPLMVKLSSDAGFVAKRRQDLKAGIRFDQVETKPVIGFGKEIILPSDEKPAEYVAPKIPEFLPHVKDILAENTSEAANVPAKADEEKPEPSAPPKKPVNPDQW